MTITDLSVTVSAERLDCGDWGESDRAYEPSRGVSSTLRQKPARGELIVAVARGLISTASAGLLRAHPAACKPEGAVMVQIGIGVSIGFHDEAHPDSFSEGYDFHQSYFLDADGELDIHAALARLTTNILDKVDTICPVDAVA